MDWFDWLLLSIIVTAILGVTAANRLRFRTVERRQRGSGYSKR
jgi:hypothetical protein